MKSDACYRVLNVHTLDLVGVPLIDRLTGKIASNWLPPVSKIENQKTYGKYKRDEATVGNICLEVSENGVEIQLTKDLTKFSEISNGDVTVGIRHKMNDGIYYTLSNCDVILEIDTNIHTTWEDSGTGGNNIKKYILTKSL